MSEGTRQGEGRLSSKSKCHCTQTTLSHCQTCHGVYPAFVKIW